MQLREVPSTVCLRTPTNHFPDFSRHCKVFIHRCIFDLDIIIDQATSSDMYTHTHIQSGFPARSCVTRVTKFSYVSCAMKYSRIFNCFPVSFYLGYTICEAYFLYFNRFILQCTPNPFPYIDFLYRVSVVFILSVRLLLSFVCDCRKFFSCVYNLYQIPLIQ